VTEAVPVTIYHNPTCGTSRNTLALIRNAGVEPTVIEYLKTPPDRATLIDLLRRMGMHPRQLLREKGTPYAELGLAADHWTDDQLIDQMLAHPILINRPIVVTPWGVKLCRPSETVLEILPLPQIGEFLHFYLSLSSSEIVTKVGYVPLKPSALTAQTTRLDEGIKGSILGGHGAVIGVKSDWFRPDDPEKVRAQLVQ